jgi:pyridoxal 5'-phosphate synthase pdxS subunit
VEAQILEAIEVDYIDESEVLTMADEENHINKNNFNVRSVGDDVINDGVMYASIIVVSITIIIIFHHHHDFSPQVPFVCGCRDLGEALRRITEGRVVMNDD